MSTDIAAIWAGALVVVYLGLTGVVLFAGRARVSAAAFALHLLLLALAAAATWMSRAPRWLRAWMPLMLVVFLYSELPALIAAAGHSVLFDATVVHWEGSVFGGQPAREMASAWPSYLLSETLHGAYLSYYGIIVVVPAALYARRRLAEFDQAMFVLMLTFVACFGAYLVFPVAGPRYLWPAAIHPGPVRAATLWLLDARSSRGTAFPSSHVAVSVTQSILALHFLGVRHGAIVAILTAGLALGAVYGGFHYAIDVVAGAVVGAAIAAAGLAMARRLTASSQANASAPT